MFCHSLLTTRINALEFLRSASISCAKAAQSQIAISSRIGSLIQQRDILLVHAETIKFYQLGGVNIPTNTRTIRLLNDQINSEIIKLEKLCEEIGNLKLHISNFK